MAGILGSSILATAGGEVSATGNDPAFENFVQIQHGNGLMSIYSHLQDLNVSIGDTVKMAQPIGTMGNSGTVVPGSGGDGSHLDFRLLQDGQHINPTSRLWYGRENVEW